MMMLRAPEMWLVKAQPRGECNALTLSGKRRGWGGGAAVVEGKGAGACRKAQEMPTE